MKTNRDLEKGQILILLVLLVIGLLGFTALAIDGGMIFADRRYMQSAADASSLAGAGVVAQMMQNADVKQPDFNCAPFTDLSDAYGAAEEQALANDFTITPQAGLGESSDHGVLITCNPAEKYIDVFVMLSRVTNTSFVHLFTGGQMRNTVGSVTRVLPGITAGSGAAIVALSEVCGNKVGDLDIWGNADVHIYKGGIWSNSCNDRGGSGRLIIDEGSIDYHQGSTCTGMPIPPGCTEHTDLHPITTRPIPPPNCTSAPYQNLGVVNNPTTISPGNYKGWTFHSEVILEPGLYCIDGDISMTSAGFIRNETVDGTPTGAPMGGVTIYVMGGDNNPAVQINGGVNTALVAVNEKPTVVVPGGPGAIEDLLLYISSNLVNVDFVINGNSGSQFAGTIYAPAAIVRINGTAEIGNPTNMGCSIIGYDVTTTGSGEIGITYNADMDYGWPSELQVQK